MGKQLRRYKESFGCKTEARRENKWKLKAVPQVWRKHRSLSLLTLMLPTLPADVLPPSAALKVAELWQKESCDQVSLFRVYSNYIELV